MDERYQQRFPVSWDQLHRDAKALAWRLAEQGPWEGIVAVTRGGLVPAAIVARELEVRLIDTVCIASYDTRNQRRPEVVKSVGGDGAGRADRRRPGRYRRAPPRWCATCCPRRISPRSTPSPRAVPLVDTFITEVSQDTWIYFPWDMELQFVQPLADGSVA